MAKTLNPHLDKVATEVRESFESFDRKMEFVSAQLVKLRYLGLEEEAHSLFGVVEYHKEEELKKLAPGTAKNYKATETSLKRFVKSKYKSDDLLLAQINYTFVVQFENYLRTCKPERSGQPPWEQRNHETYGAVQENYWVGRQV